MGKPMDVKGRNDCSRGSPKTRERGQELQKREREREKEDRGL